MAKKFHMGRVELAEELTDKLAGAARARDHQRLSALEVGGAGEALVCLMPAVCAQAVSLRSAHPADGAEGVPANVRLMRLPPYSPELNPAEKVGARLRRALANRLPKDLDELDHWAAEALRPLWEHPAEVRSQIGRGWLPLQVNASSKIEASSM